MAMNEEFICVIEYCVLMVVAHEDSTAVHHGSRSVLMNACPMALRKVTFRSEDCDNCCLQ